MDKNFRSNICGKLFLTQKPVWCKLVLNINFFWLNFFYLWVFLEKEGLVINYCYSISVLISFILEYNLQGLPKSLKSQIVTRRVQFILHIWDKNHICSGIKCASCLVGNLLAREMHELMSLQEYTKVLNSLEMHQNDDTDESPSCQHFCSNRYTNLNDSTKPACVPYILQAHRAPI